ncbi:MAG: ethylbenzene dehydrogenase-related protein [Gammaproteobacteria bacterium]
MIRRHTALLAITGLFAVVLLLALVTHSTGIVRNDPERNIWIPREMTVPLQLQVAYDEQRIFFRYRWPAERPHVYTDLLRYRDGAWQRQLDTPIGPEPDGIYEDRLAMMVDDGSVPEFQRYGGYITVGANMRDFTDAGQHEGRDDAHRRKYLPATRSDPDDWYSIVDQETLTAQRDAGYFLDLWNWRAHLSNPMATGDDQHIAWYRLYDSGEGPFFSNWDGAAQQPRFMFDSGSTGVDALRWDDVVAGRDDLEGVYYLAEDTAIPFDADREWQDGDVIPGKVLREPSGARATVKLHGEGRWADGQWDVTLVRDLDTGDPLEDKILRDQGVYTIALSVHRDAKASRWHYVSMPVQVGLGRAADITANRFSGAAPDWNQVGTHEVKLFYPGQVDWPRLTSEIHAGAKYIATGVPVKFRHSEAQLAHYGIEIEFEDEIRRQWWLSLIAGVLLVVSFVFSVSVLLGRRGN